jgi:hypothetical protein
LEEEVTRKIEMQIHVKLDYEFYGKEEHLKRGKISLWSIPGMRFNNLPHFCCQSTSKSSKESDILAKHHNLCPIF